MSGLVVFGLGSVLAALSPGATMLIASRALMGVGAAAIMPPTLSILTNFIAWKRHTGHPMLDVSVFRRLRFSVASSPSPASSSR